MLNDLQQQNNLKFSFFGGLFLNNRVKAEMKKMGKVSLSTATLFC